jgi:acetolactate synthase-1/2/3 large subunit
LLTAAQRPVIIAGLGLEPEQPYEALQALAEALQAPVIVTPKAKGALPDSHSLSAGTVGLTRTDPVYELIDEADCILALGFDVVELVKPWEQPAPLIWLAPWPNEDPTLAAEIEFVGAMKPVLNQLSDSTFQPDPAWGAQRVAAFRQQTAAAPLPEPAPGRLLPQTVMAIARQYLPDESPVAVDVGSHKILGSLTWPAHVPNRFFLSNGLSSMGFALPAMIAAALAVPDQPALCLTGDAGLSMVIGELAVVAARQLPVIVVVFNDSAIDLIRSHQVRAGYPVFGTEFASPDFSRIAAAYGIEGRRVTTPAECQAAMQQAVAARRPALIEAMIDPISYPTTPDALKRR